MRGRILAHGVDQRCRPPSIVSRLRPSMQEGTIWECPTCRRNFQLNRTPGIGAGWMWLSPRPSRAEERRDQPPPPVPQEAPAQNDLVDADGPAGRPQPSNGWTSKEKWFVALLLVGILLVASLFLDDDDDCVLDREFCPTPPQTPW